MKMKWFVACILICFMTYQSCNNRDRTPSEPSNQNAEKEVESVVRIDKGKILYKKYCVLCHGAKGDMGASGAYDLTTTKLDLNQKIEVIRKGRNTMTAFEKVLSDEDIRSVAEYTEKFRITD